MTVDQIRKAVSKSLLEGNGWPPSLPEFIALGNDPVDFAGAFSRCMAKKPEGRAEQYVYENSAFNIRRLNQGEAEKFHKRELTRAIELEKSGQLELNSERLKALPPNSVKNVNDLAREEYEAKNKGKLNPRIQAILDSKRKAQE